MVGVEVLIDVHNIRDALREQAMRIPANWERLLFIPPTDRSVVQTIELGVLARSGKGT